MKSVKFTCAHLLLKMKFLIPSTSEMTSPFLITHGKSINYCGKITSSFYSTSFLNFVTNEVVSFAIPTDILPSFVLNTITLCPFNGVSWPSSYASTLLSFLQHDISDSKLTFSLDPSSFKRCWRSETSPQVCTM